ncbi:MAG: YitT family protein [Bacteroidaceae bacterium]|nr:YitT family protein [Bacteroidaceae bacterium]
MSLNSFLQTKAGRELKDYFAIALGLLCYSGGWTIFMLPYGVTLGGVTGIAALVDLGTQHMPFHIPMQMTYFILNAILLMMALKVLGWKFCTKTIYAVIVMTLLLQIGNSTMARLGNPMVLGEGENFMSCVIGACLCGLGIGICFANNGSTGGTDIIAAMINKNRDVSLGRIVLVSDLIVIGCNYFVFHDIRRVLFGYVALILMSMVLDYYVNSSRQSVQFFIFSNKHEEIADYINKNVHRGVTVLDGMGWYSKEPMKVLVVLAKKRDSVSLFRAIKDIDPKAFVSQSNVIGVYGKGFDKIKVK